MAKTPVANLVRKTASGVYYARARIKGKLIWKSLKADTENVFDELKNQWGGRGYCSGRAVVTELAARLGLLTCNLWSLFTRRMGLNPGHHTEVSKSRRSFLFLAAQGVESGRQRMLKLAVKAGWGQVLKGCERGWRLLRRSWKPKATACACSPVKPPMIPLNGSLTPRLPQPVET